MIREAKGSHLDGDARETSGHLHCFNKERKMDLSDICPQVRTVVLRTTRRLDGLGFATFRPSNELDQFKVAQLRMVW
jgi:hypothetical protein